MLKKLLPVIAILLAGMGGLFAGDMLGPDKAGGDQKAAAPSEDPGGHGAAAADKAGGHGGGKGGEVAYFRFPSQFFVPVMRGDRLEGMMVLTLTVEMPADRQEEVYKQEFRLRDALLRTLLIQANTGGFDGNFTIEPRMRRLREALMKTASDISGGVISDVLIEDIARQESA